MFASKAPNPISNNFHFPNSVIVMSRTDGILLVMLYLLDYVTEVLTDTVSVQKALAQF